MRVLLENMFIIKIKFVVLSFGRTVFHRNLLFVFLVRASTPLHSGVVADRWQRLRLRNAPDRAGRPSPRGLHSQHTPVLDSQFPILHDVSVRSRLEQSSKSQMFLWPDDVAFWCVRKLSTIIGKSLWVGGNSNFSTTNSYRVVPHFQGLHKRIRIAQTR